MSKWVVSGAILAIVIVLNTALVLRNAWLLDSYAGSIEKTNQNLTDLQDVLRRLVDAETGQRGYFLTGDDAYLEPFRRAQGSIPPAVGRLVGRSESPAWIAAQLRELKQRAQQKLAELESTIEIRRREGFDAARAQVIRRDGKQDMDRLRAIVGELERHERRQLQLRSADRSYAYRTAVTHALVAGLSTLAAFAAFIFVLRRHLSERTRALHTILKQGEQLRTTLASIGDGLMATDAHGTITHFNVLAERLTGWQLGDAIGRPLAEVCDFGQEAAGARDVSQAGRMTLPDPAGGRRLVDYTSTPIYDEQGTGIGVVIALRDVTERERANQALQESEFRFQQIADGVEAVFYVTDTPRQVRYVSSGYRRLWGLDPQELYLDQTAWNRRMHVEDRERVESAFERFVAGQDRYDVEYRIHLPDGMERWVHDRATAAAWNQDGTVARITGLAQDVTQRKQMEASLRQTTLLLETVTETTADLIYAKDRAGRLLFANAATLTAIGKPAADVLGRNEREWHENAAEAAALAAHDASIVTAGVTRVLEEEFTGPAGRCWYLSTKTPLRDRDGNIVGIVGVSTDITARKQAEDSLRRREAELRSLADNTPDILARFDRQHRHTFVNAAVERVTGRDAAEFIGKTNGELGMPPALCQLWDASLARVFESAQPQTISFVYASQHGARHFSARLVPEHASDGALLSVLAVSHDITEQKAAEAALLAADRRKNDFIAMLGHELRNPLAGIAGGVEVLKLLEAPDATMRSMHELIDRQTALMRRLIDDLLDVSRVTQGKIQLQLAAVDLRTLVREVVADHQRVLEEHELSLSLTLPSADVYCRADQARLVQIVNNLLHNACKFTPPGGKISVVLESRDSEAALTVRDNGIGIDADTLPRVFEPFAQAERGADRRHGGLGLGLALVKGLVELHGGRVRAASGGGGQGTEFVVTLPSGEREAIVPNAESAACGSIARPLRVLVVDDHPDVAKPVQRLLELDGHMVRIAADGEQALRSLEEWRPDAVFCDIGLPGLSGYQVAQKIRAQPQWAQLYLAAVTGYGQESDRRRAIEAGFHTHLTKPVSLAGLRSVLAAAASHTAGKPS